MAEERHARLESADGDLGGRADTAGAVQRALEAAGVIFVDENGQGAGVRLRKPAPDPDSFRRISSMPATTSD